MKSVKLKRLLIVAIALLMVMSVFTLITFSFESAANAYATDSDIEAERSEAETSDLRLVLTCDVQELKTLESDQSFTLTARLEGVASVEGGVYCVSVRITPLAAGDLEFVGFTPSRDRDKGIYKSELMKTSKHKEGEYVSMEVSCDTVHAITEDIEIGSFKFKLKEDPLSPTTLKFAYRAMVTEFNLDFTSLPIAETTYELPITGISLGALIGIAVGIVAAIAIVIAVILIVDHKKKKGAKKAQATAESEADNDGASDLQKDSGEQEAVYSDNNAAESDDNIAESGVDDESNADLQEDSSAQEVIYSDSDAAESDDNVATNDGYIDGSADSVADVKEDNTTQN